MADVARWSMWEIGTAVQPRLLLVSRSPLGRRHGRAAEGDRQVLWLPACLGGGIAAVFHADGRAARYGSWRGRVLPDRHRGAAASTFGLDCGTLLALAFVAASGFALVQAARWGAGGAPA